MAICGLSFRSFTVCHLYPIIYCLCHEVKNEGRILAHCYIRVVRYYLASIPGKTVGMKLTQFTYSFWGDQLEILYFCFKT
jgi:hypothetical protein